VEIKCVLSSIVPGLSYLVSGPAHARRLGRQIPRVWVCVPEQLRLDLRLRVPCLSDRVQELRGIGCPAPASVPGREAGGSHRLVENPGLPPGLGIDHVPFHPAEMPQLEHRRERLLTSLEGQLQPAAGFPQIEVPCNSFSCRIGQDAADVSTRLPVPRGMRFIRSSLDPLSKVARQRSRSIETSSRLAVGTRVVSRHLNLDPTW
jgi:hypothetical protein